MDTMRGEVTIVPTYFRPEFLYCCLRRIREVDAKMEIAVFPDRGSYFDPETAQVVNMLEPKWLIRSRFVPDHEYYGNSYNVLEAFRWAYNEGYQYIYYVEDDVMVHRDFFSWHREQHEESPRLFASMAWVFNRHAPLTDDPLMQPWYYAIGTCFARPKLELVVKHASPRYYADMAGYIRENFKDSMLNRERPQFGIEHFEQDGLIQRVLERDKSQTVSSGIAKCTHLGTYGYNRGWTNNQDMFTHCRSLGERIDRVEALMADEYERLEIFGRDIVEREVGHLIPPRDLHYRVTIPGGWQSEFVSDLIITDRNKPARVNSVRLPPEAVIEKIS